MQTNERPRPTHPGILLRLKLAQLAHSKVAIARLLGVSRQTLHQLLAGKQRMTPSVAIRVAQLTGVAPEFWVQRQAAFDHYDAQASYKSDMVVPAVLSNW